MSRHKSKIFHAWFPALAVLIAVSGCYSRSLPKDLPKLYPCSLTFTYENGEPIEEALITLYSVDSSFKWIAGGRTDCSGKVKLATNGQYPGIPEGTFRIVLAKTESVRNGKKMDPDETLPADESPGVIQVFTFIEKQYAQRQSTPLELTVVPKSKNDRSFSCGKPTRVLLTTIIP